MKIAVCANEAIQVKRIEEHFLKWKRRGVPLHTECYLEEEPFLKSLETGHFDLIIVYVDDPWEGKETMVYHLKQKREESCIVFLYGKKRLPHSLFQVKYEAQFNGRSNVIDAEDICYLESYGRKTSIVTMEKRIRIKGRLDLEEQKFSDYQFVRINQWNIINMRYVHSVEDRAVYMETGDILYISGRRRKEFLERYRRYVRENCRIV